MEQVRFKNLQKSKAFREAVARWGEPTKAIRKRVIFATSDADSEKPVNDLSCVLKEKKVHTEPTLEELQLAGYRSWIDERKALRRQFEKCTAEEILNLTSGSKKTKKTGSLLNVAAGDDSFASQPSINEPRPNNVLAKIHKFLVEKKLRLYDLFKQADRDKDWKITNKEFKKVLKDVGLEISDQQIDQFISALDENSDDVLEYKEMVHGLQSFLLDERAAKASQPETTYEPETSHGQELTKKKSSFLLLPKYEKSDLMANTGGEKRSKREKKIQRLKKKVKTPPASPVQQSTLQGETALVVQRFHERRRREYEKVLELCHLHGVKLSTNMLQRVLLHPPDAPQAQCIASLTSSTSRNLREQNLSLRATSAKQRTSDDGESTKVSRMRKSVHVRSVYPLASSVKPRKERLELPCGSADIGSKTDCWMTYEEYHNLTRHIYSRFEKRWRLIGTADRWPSYVENRVRLLLEEPGAKANSVNAIFNVVQNKTIH